MFANVCHFPHMCGKSHWHAYFRLSYLCFVDLCLVLWPQKVWYSNLVELWSFVLIFLCFVLFFMEVPWGFNFAKSQFFFSNHQLPQNDNQHLEASGGSHSPLHRATLYSVPFRSGPRGTVSSFIFERFCLYFSTQNNEKKKTQKASFLVRFCAIAGWQNFHLFTKLQYSN